jgi:hypothetical protein
MFDNMESSEIIALALIVLAINLWIIYNIIQAATKSKSILKLQRMQVELLKEIALKNGVAAERVSEIIETHNQ